MTVSYLIQVFVDVFVYKKKPHVVNTSKFMTLSFIPNRRLLDEEDDLSEVQPDAVPNEVREWLASTFTRSNNAQKRRPDDKPKFRSVANAIRAGIMVDRLVSLYSPTLLIIFFTKS